MDKRKITALCKSFLWGGCILLFPVFTGILSAILSLEKTETLFFQGLFMLSSLAIPLTFVLNGKWKWTEIGFRKYDADCSKKAYHFLPLIAIFSLLQFKAFILNPQFMYLVISFYT